MRPTEDTRPCHRYFFMGTTTVDVIGVRCPTKSTGFCLIQMCITAGTLFIILTMQPSWQTYQP